MQVLSEPESPKGPLTSALVPFPLLAYPESYNAATFDLCKRSETGKLVVTFSSWMEVFRRSIYDFQKRAAADHSVSNAKSKADLFAKEYASLLSTIEAAPQKGVSAIYGSETGNLDCVFLCRLREQSLRGAGFQDTFADVKKQENLKALELLPAVLRDLDGVASEGRTEQLRAKEADGVESSQEQHSGEEVWAKLLRGVFAGNIFDLGATASAKLFEEAGMSFLKTRNSLSERKCAIDDFSSAVKRLCSHPYRKAILFVDNAGSDVVLGMLPLARELIKQGTAVVIAANSLPSINDVTAEELRAIVKQAGQLDKLLDRSLQEGTLQVVESGSDLPVIDLSKVSHALATACKDVDLVVLEGMGRAIETNLNAELLCDKLNLGMIKHPEVAALLHGELYDCVCKFSPANRR